MKKYNQDGGIALVVSDVILIILFLGAAGFGWWAFQQRQHYKNDTDKIVNSAVSKAREDQMALDNNKFIEQEKSPTKTYKGSDTYGAVTFNYPKTWSAYVDETNSTNPISGSFYPNIVPAAASIGGQYALRVDLVAQSYPQVLKQFDQFIKKGQVKATAYVPPLMTQNGVPLTNVQTGMRLDGQIEKNIQGAMLIIKVRDKTLKIYTESPSFLDDFNNTVLNTLTFVP